MYKTLNPVLPKQPMVVKDIEIIKKRVSKGHIHAVDNYGMQDFAINEAGWPQNSISLLARAQTLEQYNLIASRLSKTDVNNPDLSAIPLVQRFALARPRSAQLPHEFDSYLEELSKVDLARIQKAYESKLSDSTRPIVEKPTTTE